MNETIHRKRIDVFEAMKPLHKLASEWKDDPDAARQAIFHLCHVVATQQVVIGKLITEVEAHTNALDTLTLDNLAGWHHCRCGEPIPPHKKTCGQCFSVHAAQ
ncbi:MAG: hypothetical protein ACXWQR_18445 [Ktedonobacterales bacterium]